MPVGHPIARLHPRLPQTARDARRTVPQLSVRHPLAIEDDNALAVGMTIDRRLEHVEQ